MKYRVLKSVAHNIGHTFTSLLNYRADDYIIEHIFKIAKKKGISIIKVDFLNEKIEPVDFDQAPIRDSISSYHNALERIFQAQRCELAKVKSCKLIIEFDLNTIRILDRTKIEICDYKCRVSILDDRGKENMASVREWWNRG